MTGTAHDFLDRDTVLCQRNDGRVGLLAPEIAFVMKAFGRGQQLGIDPRCPERLADLSHRFADRVQEGTAGILHQMPSISDLHCIGQCPCGRRPVSAATIAGNDLDLGILPQPSFRRPRLAVRQQTDRPPTLQVTHDRAVAMIAPPGQVVDANHRGRGRRR